MIIDTLPKYISLQQKDVIYSKQKHFGCKVSGVAMQEKPLHRSKASVWQSQYTPE